MSYETPKRWSELPPGSDGPQARAASLARAARAAPAALTPEQLAALESRVFVAPPRAPSWLKPAGLASLAALAFLGWLMLRPGEAPVPPAVAVAPASQPAEEPPTPVIEEAPPLEVPEPAKPAPLHKLTRAATAAQPAPAAAAEESSLLVETRMLRAVLEELRQRRDVTAAQRALDAYFARFPNGALKNEALVARVDVLQAQGRRDDALATLNALQQVGFANVPRAVELRLLRAELLSANERCAEAVTAFAQALDEPALPPALEERALVGRASCRARLGDSAGSRADLERYLERYPEGRFAAPARSAIGK